MGLFIDNKLTYKGHTKRVVNRIQGKILHLELLRDKASFKTMKEVTQSLVHSTIEFCAELYLVNHQNQVKVQKKLNVAMRMLLDTNWEASCSDMMSQLDWLNVSNMRTWCCVRTLKRFMEHPSQAPHTWDIINMNEGPLHDVRYRAVKLNWRKFSPWARNSYVYRATSLYNQLGLHGRCFEDYKDLRDQVKSTIISSFGNKNIK